MWKRDVVYVFETHRGLLFEDGAFKRILAPGKYIIPIHFNLPFYKTPKVETKLIDIRERDLTIKGQEILTSDKVAIRVSIIVQFKVSDPKAALLEVEDYNERLYSDVQLAARRSLVNMSLEEILTNKNSLSEEILKGVREIAARYGITVMRADVKDLIFPGDVQEIMNRVLKAERISQAQLVEAKSRSQIELMEAKTHADKQIVESESQAKILEIQARTNANSLKIKTDANVLADKAKAEGEKDLEKSKVDAAELLKKYPELLRVKEIEALEAISKNANARIYVGIDQKLVSRIE